MKSLFKSKEISSMKGPLSRICQELLQIQQCHRRLGKGEEKAAVQRNRYTWFCQKGAHHHLIKYSLKQEMLLYLLGISRRSDDTQRWCWCWESFLCWWEDGWTGLCSWELGLSGQKQVDFACHLWSSSSISGIFLSSWTTHGQVSLRMFVVALLNSKRPKQPKCTFWELGKLFHCYFQKVKFYTPSKKGKRMMVASGEGDKYLILCPFVLLEFCIVCLCCH